MAEISQRVSVRLTPEQGSWVKYLLDLDKIHYQTVAKIANCTTTSVADFLNGVKGSFIVPPALCKVLGYRSLRSMLAEHFVPKKEAA